MASDLHWVQYLIANEALLDKQEKLVTLAGKQFTGSTYTFRRQQWEPSKKGEAISHLQLHEELRI